MTLRSYSRSLLKKESIHVERNTDILGGGIFIFPYFTAGVLTRGFALNAGIGDVITGALAIPVGTMVMRNTRWSGLALVLWSIFGIVDLIVAPASALIFGAAGLTDYPINFIPLFLGPPFGILIHIITLRNYWIRRQAGLFAPRKTENQ